MKSEKIPQAPPYPQQTRARVSESKGFLESRPASGKTLRDVLIRILISQIRPSTTKARRSPYPQLPMSM
jgi:hypothetical protein